MSAEFLITASAYSVTPQGFFRALFPKRSPEEQAEREQALRDHQAAVQASYRLPSLMDGIVRREQLEAEYEARLLEIEKRYVEQFTETLSDPLSHLEPMEDAALDHLEISGRCAA